MKPTFSPYEPLSVAASRLPLEAAPALNPLKRFHAFLATLFFGTSLAQFLLPLAFRASVRLYIPATGVYDLEKPKLNVMCGLFLLLAAIDHFLQFFYWPGSGANVIRWVEYSMSATLMMLLIAMSVGIQDVMVLSLLVVLRLSMLFHGFVVERDGPAADRRDSVLGWLYFFVTWSVLIVYYAFAISDRSEEVPIFVHLIIAFLLTLESSFGVIQALTKNDKSPARRELLYCVASFVSKQLLAWLLWGGFYNREQSVDKMSSGG